MCSETSAPRLSFSHDLGQEDDVPPIAQHNLSRKDSTLLDSNSDFEFSIGSSFDHESSPADELFSNGVILPIQIREKVVSSKHRPIAPLPPLPCENSKKETIKELMAINSELEQKPVSKSFWGFNRSSSLNSDSKRSLLCSLPLLSRSNSTGSAPKPNRSTSKDAHKHSSLAKSSSSSSAILQQKPPLKKNYGGSYSNGSVVRISPVLNVPPPYISKRTANLFGLGSFLRDGKDKKSKK